MERIEHDLEHVAALDVEVLLQFRDEDLVRLRFVDEGADVQMPIVVQHAHLRLFGGRLAFARLALQESGGHGRVDPRRFVERSVDDDRPRRAHGRKATVPLRRTSVARF